MNQALSKLIMGNTYFRKNFFRNTYNSKYDQNKTHNLKNNTPLKITPKTKNLRPIKHTLKKYALYNGHQSQPFLL